MAAAVGANLDPKVVIIMGFSNLIADALSMGFGDYLSSNAERNYINAEKKKETYEYKIHRNHEIKELAQLYVYNGMEVADAIQLVDILASKEKYTKIFINHMMTLELDLPEAETPKDIFIKALFTFISFTIFGSVPVIRETFNIMCRFISMLFLNVFNYFIHSNLNIRINIRIHIIHYLHR